MSDDLEKACRDWWTDRPEQYDAAASDEQHIASLTAFVREQVPSQLLDVLAFKDERIAALEAEYKYSADTCNRYAEEINSLKDRIAALEAEAAANYALYEKKGTELDGTIRHIEALEAALEEACDLAEEASSYVDPYFRTKHGLTKDHIDIIRAKTKVKP